MNHVSYFSFSQRAADKAAVRARDEKNLRLGVISAAQMARVNGGGFRKVKYIGPSARIQRLAASS